MKRNCHDKTNDNSFYRYAAICQGQKLMPYEAFRDVLRLLNQLADVLIYQCDNQRYDSVF